MNILLAMQGALSQGVLWGVMALGVYITFRLLDIADLSVDGSFATGGAVCAVAIMNGVNPVLSLVLASIAGGIAGWITGLLHTKCHIPAILAGILTQIALYSVNLRIMGRSNLPLLKFPTVFKSTVSLLGVTFSMASLIIGLLVAILVVCLLYWYFGTEMGSAIRATGNNAHMARAQGINTNFMKLVGLILSNGLVALSGALVTQSQGYADVKQGIGAIVIGLASIVIGEVIFGHRGNFMVRLASIVVGSILYRVIVAVVLQMGLSTDDLKLLTAALVAIALSVPVLLSKHQQISLYKKLTGKEMDHA